jgi:hypothetical protein
MIIIAVTLVIAVALLWRTRRSRRPAAACPRRGDGPARVVGWAIALLPADRADWGQAMAGEADHLTSPRERWRFAVGCLRGALLLPPPGGRARPAVVTTVSGTGACAAAVAYALAAYPGLLTRTGTWVSVAVFAVVLAGCVLVTAVCARRSPAPGLALAGGVAVAAGWVLAGTLAAGGRPHPAYALSPLFLPLAALAVGVIATRMGRTAAAGRHSALLAAVATGLTLFLILAAITFATAASPYDSDITRAFPASGFHDLPTYYISDSLGTAVALLLLSVALVAALGCLSATLTPAPSAPGTEEPASGEPL